ncbi:hypothetical protein DPMN_010712 [Dreissena polymorpha]|uniref:Uncharacterized protein n=1 Tax=Dreissena polymorpha TaxID=45954 RepID=A0A9D4N3N7_DREPO|nr:hypothetical protein DPMN_010712 [Dreissena polymorpha]
MQTNGKYGDLQPRHTIIDRESFAVFSLTCDVTDVTIKNVCTGRSGLDASSSLESFEEMPPVEGASSRLETFSEMHQHLILFNIQTPARILAEIVENTRFVFMQTNGTSGDLQPRHTIIGCGIYKTAMASMVNSPSLILA